MSMSLMYSVREGIHGLRRARTATAITVSTVALTLGLLGLFLVLTLNIKHLVDYFRERMAIEVFIDPGLSAEETNRLEHSLGQVEGVETVVFISAEKALERFREELGADLLEILGEYPLPASFQITVKREFRSAAGLEGIARQLHSLSGVEDVVYHGRLYQAIERYSRVILLIDGVLFTAVFLGAVLLIANTLRLTILTQDHLIRNMRLVGATEAFVRRPYLIQGMLQGGIGGFIATLMIWIILAAVGSLFPRLLRIPPWLVFTPIGLGFLLGWMGSRLGVKRFLKS